jgi:hypothetical protein
VTHAHEACGDNVEQEAADEFNSELSVLGGKIFLGMGLITYEARQGLKTKQL